MPSGVSHGSAPPAGTGPVVCSKAISAKFGMRLMGVHYSTGEARGGSIMVRMLVADAAVKLFRTVILQRGLARQVGDADHPAEPGFGGELLGRNQPGRPVKGAGHDLDSWGV